MPAATGLYLISLLLITLFTDVVFGVNAQSLAYVPLTLALIVLVYAAMAGEQRDFLGRWYTSSPMIVPGLLFLAGLALALPHARDLGLAGRDFVRWSFVWLVFAPVTRAICSTPGRARLCARVVPIFISTFAALTVADLVFGGGIVRTLLGVAGVTGEGRYQSLYQNAGIFAGMLIVGLPLALVPALTERRWRSRAAWGVAVAVLAAGVLLSGARAAVVASLVAIAVIGVLLRRRWLTVAVAGAVVAGGGLMLSGDLGGPPSLSRFQDVLMRSGTGHRSLNRRLQVWSAAGELIERNPVIGLGGSQFRHHQRLGLNRAHNAWLDAWLDGGLPAALAMVIVTAVVLRRAWLTHFRRPARWLDPTHVALLAACLAVLTGWTVRAGIGGRIDWLPIFMLCSVWWDLRICPEREQCAGAPHEDVARSA
jgi:O-antigen ligase